MKYKTRHLLSGILSICLAFIVTISGVELSGFQKEFSIDVEAGLSDDSQGSLIGGAEMVHVDFGEGNKQWYMEYEPFLYISWAKTDASNLVNANDFFVKQINEGGYADRWVYDTTLAWGVPNHTEPYGLILTANEFYSGCFVCNIGSNGSMPSYIQDITETHMTSGVYTCSKSTRDQVRELLTRYFTGSGNSYTMLSQEQIMPNTVDGLCAIYTLLYKYGGMPYDDYVNAMAYTQVGTSSNGNGYSIISTMLGFPADMCANTYSGELDQNDIHHCDCKDPNNHDVRKHTIHRNWLNGILKSKGKEINSSSYLLKREENDNITNADGKICTKFAVTWDEAIPVWLKAAYPDYINEDKLKGKMYDAEYYKFPLLTTCFDMVRLSGQNVCTDMNYSPIKFIAEDDYMRSKQLYWLELNTLVPMRNMSNMAGFVDRFVPKQKEYGVGETPRDADGNPILDMNGNPIIIPPYNHYFREDGTEYVSLDYVNFKQIGPYGSIPSGTYDESRYTPASALTVFNNGNRWPYVYRDSDGVATTVVEGKFKIEGINSVEDMLLGVHDNFYTGIGSVIMNYSYNWFASYCVSPSQRESGSNLPDSAFAGIITCTDSLGHRYWHYGHSYLTVAGSDLQFDISGYVQGELINLVPGEEAEFTPHYDIRLHAKSEEDLYTIDTSVIYALMIEINFHKGYNLRNDLSNKVESDFDSVTSNIGTVTVQHSGNDTVLVLALKGDTLRNLFSMPETPIITVHGKPVRLGYGKTVTIPVASTIIIQNMESGVNTFVNAVNYDKNPYPGFKAYKCDCGAHSVGTNYASCTTGPIDRIPWGQNSSINPSAYAEIVANEVGNQDWNVLQGIPSTENLSISAGGDAFLVGYSGWTYRVGNACGKTYSNSGVGEVMPSPGLTRKITINTTIKDIWGPAESNVPCTLSCSGAHPICSVSTSTDPGAPGPLGPGASSNGSTANEFTCDVCGSSFRYTWGGGVDHKDAVLDEETGAIITPEVQEVTGSWSGGHSCTATVTYNCSTGKFTKTSQVSGGPDSDMTENANKQHYNAQPSTWTCRGGATMSGSCVDDTLIDEGYTRLMGCACSNNQNHQHKYDSSDRFYVYEYVDAWYYRQLKNVRLYGLSKSYIKDINTNVLNTGANQSAACVGLKACVWRASESSGFGKYKNGNGRIWFQQFNTPTYSSGGLAWNVTGTDGSGSTYDYWLGDCVVNITAYADRAAYENQALSDTNIGVYNMSVRSNAGKADGHTGNVTPTSSNDTWKTGKYTTGDWLFSTEISHYHLKLVNTWQNKNNIEYVITSISDTMALAVNDNYAENITGSVYNITNNGSSVRLFNYPFTSTNKSHYRCFVNPMGNTLTAEGGGNVLQSNQPTLKVGFNGAVNQVAQTTGLSYNDTLAYGLATGSVTPDLYGGTGGDASSSRCYTGKISITNSTESGCTTWELVNTESSDNPQSFDGYWQDHDYPNTGTYKYVWKQNGSVVPGTEVTTTNSGQGNLNTYDNQLVISNIDILGSARNGSYIPCTVYNNYVVLADHVPDQSHPLLTIYDRALNYKAGFRGANTNINNVIIHDPISVQHCEVISNGAGAYANGVVDESGEDMRTSTAGKAEHEKADYVVIGNTIHITYSDIGDFYSPIGTEMSGSSTPSVPGIGDSRDGCNPDTGVKSNARGYTNNMNCSTWVKERYVKFPFPVSYIDRDNNRVVVPAEKYIPLSNVMGIGASGNKGYYDKGTVNGDNVQGATIVNGTPDLFHKMSNSRLDVFETDERQYYYGLDFEFTCLTSAVEAQLANIEFLTTAINDVDTTTNNNFTDHTNEDRKGKEDGMQLAAESTVRKRVSIDIVGRIGNLTINDTGDFRFSNLFKATTSGYLIPGVVKNTDYRTPNSIVSTRLDILGNLVSNNLTPSRQVDSTYKLPGLNVVTNHATLSVSNYKDTLGKAGSFYEFPLTAGINNIPEFTNEQLRPGYDILMDVETLGNYYGINYKDEAAYYGPVSVDELNSDTRTNVVTVIPHYYLYSPSLKRYIDIDIYSGVEGQRKLLWTDSSLVTGNTAASLYVDFAKETYRRNVSDEELKVTETVLSSIDSSNTSFKVSAEESDFIGTNAKIVLDAKNRTFIGSNVLYGNYKHHGDQMETTSGWSQSTAKVISLLYQSSDPETLIDDTDFLMRSQRYHFALGLPSSTYITECGLHNPSQNAIEDSHNKLKRDYPDGVVVCMLEIYAKDDVWELEYDDGLVQGIAGMSNEQVKVYLSSGADIDDPSDDIYLYRPGMGASYYGTNINPKWALTVVMDAWHTSAQDLETYGTH